MLEHGGQLRRAAQRSGRPLEEWLDLSTGVNPRGWQDTVAPDFAWGRLPEECDGLAEAAQDYYRAPRALPIAGSQAAIITLPRMRAVCRVGVLAPAYFEHALRWQQAGHEVLSLAPARCEAAAGTLDVMVLVSPNNPTGHRFSRDALLRWHAMLASRGGWLVVDEAFADAAGENSLATLSERDGLIVLRSLGKFFGLPGARVGFVLAAPSLLTALAQRLGRWTLSGPSRIVACRALQDRAWQAATRDRLRADGTRLAELLEVGGLRPAGGCELFQWCPSSQARRIHESLARMGILTRLFESPASLRFGLRGSAEAWQRLEAALRALPSEELCELQR
jgi:L-threonine-O-3-phosphate decarboxylase